MLRIVLVDSHTFFNISNVPLLTKQMISQLKLLNQLTALLKEEEQYYCPYIIIYKRMYVYEYER